MNINISFDAHLATAENLPKDLWEMLKFNLLVELEEDKQECWKNLKFPFSPVVNDQYTLINSSNQFPTGLLPVVIYKIREAGHQVSLTKNVKSAGKSNLPLNPVLRPAQIEFVESALKKKRGTLQAPTSFGKSFCIAELCRQFTGNVIVLVHRQGLMRQMQKEIAAYLEVDLDEIGILGDQKCSLKRVTIAIDDSVVSRHKSMDVAVCRYLSSVEVLIVDEVHRFINPTFAKISAALSSVEYKLGISATVFTKNKNLLEGLFGPRIFTAEVQDTIDSGAICDPVIEFYPAPKAYVPKKLIDADLSNLPVNQRYAICNKLYDYLIVNNKGRNQLAADIAYEFIQKKEGPLLVIVTKVGTSGKGATVSHAEIFKQMMEEKGVTLPIIHGKTPKQQFEDTLSQLEDYEIPGAIASSGIFTDALSVKSISGLILLTAGKGGEEGRDLVQRIGRALRKKEGKGRPIIWDFMDPVGYFANQSKARLNIAQSLFTDVRIVEDKKQA